MIHALYYRHHSPYSQECNTLAEAISFLEEGESEGSLSSTGVFDDTNGVAYHNQYRTPQRVADHVMLEFGVEVTKFETYELWPS